MPTTTDPTLQPLLEVLDQVLALPPEADLRPALEALLAQLILQPLAAETVHELEQACERALDRLYRALNDPQLWQIDVLSRVSIALFAAYLRRFRAAKRPDQRTRWRVVLVTDDSLLPHSWGSEQEGLAVLKDPALKAYLKAHNGVLLFVTIGEGRRAFPLFLALWDPAQRHTRTKVHLACQALDTLATQLSAFGLSLDGLDLVFDHWYLKPGLIETAQRLGLHLTSKLARNEQVTLEDGRTLPLKTLLWHLVATLPRHDARLGPSGDYWRVAATHPRLGQVVILVRRRSVHKGCYFKYDFVVTTRLDAKAITVLHLMRRRWDVEVFFREAKQHLGLAGGRFHALEASLLYCRIRALTYLVLIHCQPKLPLPPSRKTVGKLKERFRAPLLAYFKTAA